MTTLQSILAKHSGQTVDRALVSAIRAEVKQHVGKGISKEYYARATRANGILTQKKLAKAIQNAVSSENSFNPAVIIEGGRRYWEEHKKN
jgi:hypothetical protein